MRLEWHLKTSAYSLCVTFDPQATYDVNMIRARVTLYTALRRYDIICKDVKYFHLQVGGGAIWSLRRGLVLLRPQLSHPCVHVSWSHKKAERAALYL